jgi:hypothetical protein
MTNSKQQSLINARRACLLLVGFATGEDRAIILSADEHREQIADLLDQFGRLDRKERKQIAAGRKHGAKGGRPRKSLEPEK